LPHEVRFGMAGAVTLGQYGVLSFQKDIAVFIDEHSAKGMVAVLARPSRNVDGGSQMFQIAFGHFAFKRGFVCPAVRGSPMLLTFKKGTMHGAKLLKTLFELYKVT
jgi:hypothetical protein